VNPLEVCTIRHEKQSHETKQKLLINKHKKSFKKSIVWLDLPAVLIICGTGKCLNQRNEEVTPYDNEIDKMTMTYKIR